MDRGTLDHALEGSGGHGFGPFDISDEGGEVVIDEFDKGFAQRVKVDRAGLHHTGGIGFIDQGQQQMFQRRQFVAAGICQRECAMDGCLKGIRKRWHVLVLLSCGRRAGIARSHLGLISLKFGFIWPASRVISDILRFPVVWSQNVIVEAQAGSEFVFAGADFGEDFGVGGVGQAKGDLQRGGAQEGVGCQFEG